MRSPFCGREKEMALLQAAWARASNGDNPEPQLVVMTGESGLGKTRITQEFYSWLSTTHDATEPKGYWPDDLGQEENNLKVNPQPEACDNREPMPFLWWGVRLHDPSARNTVQAGSALNTSLSSLTPHLKPVLNRLRQVERQVEGGKTLGKAALDVGLSLIPGAGALGSIKTAIETLYELTSLGQQSLEDKQARSMGDIRTEEHKSQSDLVLNSLSTLVSGSGSLAATPVCLLIDDAQFSRADPALSAFIEQLISRAFSQQWPLLIIITHWQAEWHQDWQESHPTVAAAIRTQQHHLPETWQPLELLPIEQLGPMLKQALPGLLPEQSTALLQRAGGNPRYLDEIIRFCQRQPRHFIERDLSNPLSKKGFEQCLQQSLSLHELILDRFDAMPAEVKQAIALASMQGQRFLTQLTMEVAQVLALPNTEAGLKGAEHPHSLVNGVPSGIAEFAQRIFHEVASETLDDIMDGAAAHSALQTIMRQRLDDELATPTADLPQREMTLAVAAGLFEQAEAPDDRLRAARALAELTTIELARYDYVMAQQIAQRFLAGIDRNAWPFSALDFSQLWDIQKAFHTMGQQRGIQQLAQAMQTSAQQNLTLTPGDRVAQRNLFISWCQLGELARQQGELEQAKRLYQQGLEISERLVHELNTPEARRDLTVSWVNLGGIAQKQGDLEQAKRLFRQVLEISERLAHELNTPQARRDLSLSWERLGEIAQQQGDLDQARHLYQQGVEINEPLARELNSPGERSALSLSWGRLGDIVQQQGDLEQAKRLYQQGLDILECLARDLSTPDVRGNLSVSYDRLGDIAQKQGDLEQAKHLFQQGLEISEQLARELNTPGIRRGLSVSWGKLGELAQKQGDLDQARRLFQQGLEIRETLARELNTPEARRDLSVSWGKLGDIAQQQGNLDQARRLFQQALEISETLARELNTPEVRRDLAVSYAKLAQLAEDQGEPEAALQAFLTGLEQARIYQTMMPCPDADQLISAFDSDIQRLRGE